jgi:hypothetical protein
MLVLVLAALTMPFGISRFVALGYFAATLLLIDGLGGRHRHVLASDRSDLAYRVLGLAALAAQIFWFVTPLSRRSSGVPLLVLMVAFVGWSLMRLLEGLAREPRVNRHVLLGSVAGYLLIEITGGVLITVLETVYPGSFESVHDPEGLFRGALQGKGGDSPVWELDFVRMNYFAFVSLTTVGFGDVLPKSPLAQITTIGLTVLGPVYMAVVMGLLISRLTTQARNDRPDED